MGYDIVANGEVPDEDYFNNMLMRQTNIVATSGTRPTTPTPTEGMVVYETDTNKFVVYESGAWQTKLDLYTQSYSPTWTGAGGNPSLGNGTLTGRYLRLAAKMYFVEIQLLVGSTTTGGSGRWLFSLPAAPTTTVSQTLSALMEGPSQFRYPGTAFLTNASHIFTIANYAGTANIGVQPTLPFTWATGHGLLISGIYEAA